MTRLPHPGQDAGDWGNILNDYLLVEHDGQGRHNVNKILDVPNTAGRVLVSDPSDSKSVSWRNLSASDVGLTLDTDTGLAADSNLRLATQHATKTYVDAQVAANDSGRQRVFNVRDYGAAGDGSTDDTSAVMQAINAASAAGGGTVFLPAGTYRCDGAISIPYDGVGTNSPKQKPIRITGDGAMWDGQWHASPMNGGTILDLRYDGTDGQHPAKIDTRGTGTLEIDHLVIKSGGSDNFQIMQTTNTTVFVHNCGISGNQGRIGTSCLQDFIRFGGTSNAIDDSADAPFQGYGSRMYDNFYDRIRRGATFGNYANNIVIGAETFSTSCGSSEPHGAAYVFDAGTAAGDSANFACQIQGTTFEAQNYPHMVALFNNSQEHLFTGMGYYDPHEGNPSISQFYFDAQNCGHNTIIAGFGTTSTPLTAGNATAIARQTIIDGREAMESYFPYGITGDQFRVGGDIPWMRWQSTQPGAHVWKWIAAYNDPGSLSLLDETDGRQSVIFHGDGHVTFAGGVFAGTDLKLPNVGGGIYVREGVNATMGVATLVNGEVTVNTTKVTSVSRIQLTAQNLNGVSVPSALGISSRVEGGSFTIKASQPGDNSIVAWQIIEPA